MNIDLVTHRYPPDVGGIERHVQELAHHLVESGHEVTVHATRWRRGQRKQSMDNGVPVRRYRALAPGEGYYLSPSMTAVAKNSTADVIHAHGYHAFPLLFAALGAGETPFVATPHYTGRGSTRLRNLFHRAYAPFGGRALRTADATIAVSQWEQEQLRTQFSCESVVVPNGIDVESFRNADPHEHDRPYLLSIGRLVEYKGVQHAIRAMTELPEYDLLVAGTGEYRERLQRIADREDIADQVEFLGFVDDDAVPGLYAGAAAHVFLSEFECFGLTVGEALAARTPCAVRDATALSEWDAHEGCLSIEEVEPAVVADAVRRAVELEPNPQSLLTWEEMGNSVLQIYERVRSGT